VCPVVEAAIGCPSTIDGKIYQDAYLAPWFPWAPTGNLLIPKISGG
jgi:hypothetical protein